MLKFFFNYFSIFSIFCCLSSVKNENMNLELVHVIFRHGLRTPSKTEAACIGITDPAVYGVGGFGQLTNGGKRQIYELGNLIRERYDEFLGTYKYDEIHAQSSGQPRTLMSLQLFLAGLYSSSLKNKWNDKLNWNPIPYYYTPFGSDPTLASYDCPNFFPYFLNVTANSDEFQRSISNFTDFIDSMAEKTGIDYSKNVSYPVAWTWNGLLIHRALHLPFPSWYTEEIFENYDKLAKIVIEAMSLNYQLRRLLSGRLISKLLENIDENNNADRAKKLYLYSTHDLTLKGFVDALNITINEHPTFGSAIIVEKYRDNDKQEYIKLIFWNGSHYKTLKINSCEIFCALKKYRKIVEGLIPTDEELNFLLGKKNEL